MTIKAKVRVKTIPWAIIITHAIVQGSLEGRSSFLGRKIEPQQDRIVTFPDTNTKLKNDKFRMIIGEY